MLSEQEFQSWCTLMDFTKETIETVQKIRTSPPSRSVRSSKYNVAGRYPSKKWACRFNLKVTLWS